MEYLFHYTRRARKDLEALSKKTISIIVLKLEYYRNQDNPFNYAKSLSGSLNGLYRFRMGDYRAIFYKNASGKIIILTIIRIKHRKNIYD